MNYRQALQRKDGRYDYTLHNNRIGTAPIGYCAGWSERTEEEMRAIGLGDDVIKMILADIEMRRPHRDKYHRDGHATPEEAQECYKRYVMDNELVLDRQVDHGECLVCKALTRRAAEADHRLFILCDEHCTREQVEKLFQVGTSASSW